MEWDRNAVATLYDRLRERRLEMKKERPTDRRNFSALWNRYLEGYGIVLLQSPAKSRFQSTIPALFGRLMDLINYENGLVRDALVVANPDRPHQYLVVPREAAEKILVLGMI